MNLFVCLVNPSGERVPDRVRERYAAQRCWQARATQWHSAPGWAALASSDSQIGNGPQVTTWLSHPASASSGLDNREEIARHVGCRDPHLSDMGFVTRLIAERGGEEIRTLLGDFSFVIWDHSTRTLIAACDAFAIRKLYYAEAPGLLAFASRAELLADDEKYDVRYLAEVVAYAGPRGDRTAYRGVTALPAAGIARLMGRQLQLSRFWSAYDYSASPSSPRRAHEQIEECRELMMRAVASCLTGERMSGPTCRGAWTRPRWSAWRNGWRNRDACRRDSAGQSPGWILMEPGPTSANTRTAWSGDMACGTSSRWTMCRGRMTGPDHHSQICLWLWMGSTPDIGVKVHLCDRQVGMCF